MDFTFSPARLVSIDDKPVTCRMFYSLAFICVVEAVVITCRGSAPVFTVMITASNPGMDPARLAV